MKDMIIPAGLDLLLESNINLKDFNNSVKKLRVAFIEENPSSKLIISPANYRGMLGFESNGKSSDNIRYHVKGISTSSPGVTLLDLADDGKVIIHTSRKTWPKEIQYDFLDYRYYQFINRLPYVLNSLNL